MADEETTTAKFWDCEEGCELLTCTEIAEAVEQWADQCHPLPLPETVTVYGFNSLALPPVERMADDLLYRIIEDLDENFGSPDEASDHTAAMKQAAVEFARVLRAEYTVWRCDPVTSVVVKVADYVPAEWMQRSATSSAS